MLITKGRLFVGNLRQSIDVCSMRLLSIPQTTNKHSETTPVSQQKPKKAFMKDIFLGLIDCELLRFPRRTNINLPGNLEQLLSEVINVTSFKNYNERLKFLSAKGLLKLYAPESLGGIKVATTDLLHFYEKLDVDPALAALIDIHASIIIPTFLNRGSDEQKELLLKSLLRGEITGSIAVSEKSGGSDPTSISTTAKEETDGSYILNGEKIWVTNALLADFYVVLAKVPVLNIRRSDGEHMQDLSAFIVRRDNSILIKKHRLLGLNECDIASLTFNNNLISANDILGPVDSGVSVATESLKNPKFATLTCLLNALKKIIADVSVHINNRRQYPRDLKDSELVKTKITYVMSIIYSLESMLYFTSDMMDKYDIDTTIESALLQIYGFDKGLEAFSFCLDLLGSKAYDVTYDYEKMWRDLRGLSLFTSIDMIKLFASLIGLQHVGDCLKETVKKNRDPFNFPLHIVKNMFRDMQFDSRKVKLNLNLFEHFHPSLKGSSDELEESILYFKFAVEVLLSRHGNEIIFRQLELNRLICAAIDIFSMVSVLTRASHSYCTGVQNSDEEIILAQSICFSFARNAKRKLDEALSSDFNDSHLLNIGLVTLNKQCYFIEHPLKHDI